MEPDWPVLSRPASPSQPPVSVKEGSIWQVMESQSMEVFVRVSVFLATLVLPACPFFALLTGALLASPLVEGALRPSITDYAMS